MNTLQIKCALALVLTAPLWLETASAQTIASFRVNTERVAPNTAIIAQVEFKGTSCGMAIDWGDGKEHQNIRIGREPDAASPVTRQRTFEKPGTYILKAYGVFVSRGLNSLQKCEGTLQPITIIVFDPAQEKEKEAREAARLETERGKLEEERMALEQKAKELEFEKQRLKDPAYQRQLEELEKKRIAEANAQRIANEIKEKVLLAEAAKKADEDAKVAAAQDKEKKRLENFNAGSHDWFGNPRDYNGAIWISSRETLIGTDSENGKLLSDILGEIAGFSFARREAILKAESALRYQNPSLSLAHSAAARQNAMNAEAAARKFVSLWDRQPKSYRLKFARPPHTGIFQPPAINDKKQEVNVYVDEEGGIRKIQPKTGVSYLFFCRKGDIECR